MQIRNLKLLIIVLIAIVVAVFGYLYFYKPVNKNGGSENGSNFISQLFPFGKSSVPKNNEKNPIDVSGYVPPDTTQTFDPKLKKVSSMPIAGYTVFMKEKFKDVPPPSIPDPNVIPFAPVKILKDKKGKIITPKPVAPPTEFIPTLRYVEKATGNIYQTLVEKIEERKFSDTVIPKVYQAYFGSKGEAVLMRYLKADSNVIETFARILPKELLGGDSVSNNEIKGSFLPENITDLSMSPDKNNVFYLFKVGNGSAGVVASALGDKKNQIFDSPFTEWLTGWPNDKVITLTTKPTSGEPGYMYVINPDKKDLVKVLSQINGLTTLMSPDGKTILYGDDGLSLNVYNLKTGESNLLGVKTMPEKCVWGNANYLLFCAVPKIIPQSEYPDAWYRGEVSFADEIWRIDVVSGNATKIFDPALINVEEIDATDITLDENGNYLFLVNKKDSFLWELNLR